MRMILKVALKSLKIGYVQVETPKFPRSCTLACNCKIIWDSEFDEVGGFPRKFQSYPLGETSRKIMLNFNFPKRFPWKIVMLSMIFLEISRVTLKFSWQLPNFMTIFNPQDFRLGGEGTRFR